MADELLNKIDAFLALSASMGRPVSDWTFGYKAVSNGRLVERLRTGSEIYRSTERRILAYIEIETEKFNATHSEMSVKRAAEFNQSSADVFRVDRIGEDR